MQFADWELSIFTHDTTVGTGHDGFDFDAKATTAVPSCSSTAGVADLSSCLPSTADTSPRTTVWIADGGLGAVRLRMLHEVQDTANRAMDVTGASDVLGPTVLTADDGRVYSVHITAAVEEVSPEIARELLTAALVDCLPDDTARREVLESHLRHLPTCRADHTITRVRS